LTGVKFEALVFYTIKQITDEQRVLAARFNNMTIGVDDHNPSCLIQMSELVKVPIDLNIHM